MQTFGISKQLNTPVYFFLFLQVKLVFEFLLFLHESTCKHVSIETYECFNDNLYNKSTGTRLNIVVGRTHSDTKYLNFLAKHALCL